MQKPILQLVIISLLPSGCCEDSGEILLNIALPGGDSSHSEDTKSPRSRELNPVKNPPKFQTQRRLARKLSLRAVYFCRLCRPQQNRFLAFLGLPASAQAGYFRSLSANAAPGILGFKREKTQYG